MVKGRLEAGRASAITRLILAGALLTACAGALALLAHATKATAHTAFAHPAKPDMRPGRANPARATATPLSWSPIRLIDQEPPFGSGNAIQGMSCLSTHLCVAIDNEGNVLSSRKPSGGTAAWKRVLADRASAMEAISCPSRSLCVAVDGSGRVFTSTNPTGGARAWRVERIDANHELTGVSCPSATFCVAVDAVGYALTSTNPRGAWKRFRIDPKGHGGPLACASRTLCVVDQIIGEVSAVPDDIVSSTNPAGGTSAWHIQKAPAGDRANALACPSVHVCVGGGVGPGVDGVAFVSTDPTGPTSAWHVSSIGGAGLIVSAACRSTSLCLLGDDSGSVASSSNPIAATWKPDSVVSRGPAIEALACPSKVLCLAGDENGDVVASKQPTGSASAWHAAAVDGQSSVLALACPSRSLCVATDDAGKILVSRHPNGGAAAWKVVRGLRITPNLEDFESTAVYDFACPSISLCVTAQGGRIIASTSPAGGASTWKATASLGGSIDALSCPSVRLCVAFDNPPPKSFLPVRVLAATDPAGGTSAWRTTVPTLPSSYVDVVNNASCASVALCIGGGNVNLTSSTDALGGVSSWHLSASHDIPIDSVSCPATTLCVAVDDAGEVLSATHPVHGPWHHAKLPARISFSYVDCASRTLCVGAGNGIVTSTNPTGGAGAWHLTGAARGRFTVVSCPSASFCVAAGGESVTVGTRPHR